MKQVEQDRFVSQYDDYNLSKQKIVDAIYVKPISAQDEGNPYIMALPYPRKGEDVFRAYTKILSDYNYEETRNMSTYERLIQVNNLRQLRFPLPFDDQLEIEFYSSLVTSYRGRYVIQSKQQNVDYFLNDEKQVQNQILVGNQSDATNAGFSLLGYSGCGKTSAINCLLTNYPQVIIHKKSNLEQFTQIVYLVVNCVANSNFNALYNSIGDAIDKALGNITPVYYSIVSKCYSLGMKLEKIRQLIEIFGIGIIILDEIQLIDFERSKENSFEGFMTLSNKTKVAIGVVGTEDAKNKMFKYLRTARRVGQLIDASYYCTSFTFFKFVTLKLFEYQWFDEFITPNDEIINMFYELTNGIMDQLISLYICLHYEFLTNKSKQSIDKATVQSIYNKYYPNIKLILKNIKNNEKETKMEEVKNNVEKLLNLKLTEIKQKEAIDKIIERKDSSVMLSNVIKNIQKCIDCSQDDITDAFNKVMATDNSEQLNENEVCRLVVKRLSGTKQKSKPRRKNERKITMDQINDYLGI